MSNQKIMELRLMTTRHAGDLLELADEYEREAGAHMNPMKRDAAHEHAFHLTTAANYLLLGEMIVALLAAMVGELQQFNNPLRPVDAPKENH